MDARGREAIAVLRCSTRSFALLDGDDKAWAVQAWSRVQAGMAQRTSVARIAVQDYTVPYPSTALRDFYETASPRPAGDASELTWGERAYEDLIAAAGSAMSHDLLSPLSWTRPRPDAGSGSQAGDWSVSNGCCVWRSRP